MRLADRKDCCGCEACAQKCPCGCISMEKDKNGFAYPAVNADECIGCGLCTEVCPVLNVYEARRPKKVLAARNPDEGMRLRSSSGGIFTMLAEKVIDDGGVVFGAAFDEKWNVVHKAAVTIGELAQFRGSKYVQSAVGDCFDKIQLFLENGREVLFSGTSCQIAGLNHFLGGKYDNLLTVEIICHGVPAPASWKGYLKTLIGNGPVSQRIGEVNFRDKSVTGWRNFSLTVKDCDGSTLLSQKCSENAFMQDFLNDRIIRESCFSCPARGGRSGSDIAIADYWGINKVAPELDDNMGVSLVLLESERGAAFFGSLDFSGGTPPVETTYEQALARNRSLEFNPEKK